MTKAAHDAIRGSKRSADEVRQRAQTHERTQTTTIKSSYETEFSSFLKLHKMKFIWQKAIDVYNIDFVVNSRVAVELFGGGWHSHPSHMHRHLRRTKTILESGLDLLIVWINPRRQSLESSFIDALHQIVSLLKLHSTNPSAPSQYRVIRSAKYFPISRDINDNDFPVKPPAIHPRRPRSKNPN
jgi:very-short-patch-repair endonuclease